MYMLRISQAAALALMLAAVGLAGSALAQGSLSATLAQVAMAGTTFTIGFYVDLLAAVLLGFVGSIGLIVSAYSVRNLRGQQGLPRFGAALAVSYLALALMITGASLPVMALGWTVSGLLLTVLVAHRASAGAVRAAAAIRRQLLVGDLMLWSGVIALGFALPSLDRVAVAEGVTGAVALSLAVLLMTGAAAVRSGLFPFSGWLPLTAEAPSPVSAYLHAGVVNGAAVLVALWWPLFRAAPVALGALIVLGVASAVAGAVISKVRPDVKGQLAASTGSQMGYMAIQLGLGLPAAAVLHLIGHGYYKSWLFLRAGGAVTRRRQIPLPDAGSWLRGVAVTAVAAVLSGAVLVIAWPQVSQTLALFGPVGLLPIAAAALTSVVALRAILLRAGRAPAGSSALAAAGVLATLGGYVLVLAFWDGLVAEALPEAAVWAVPVALGWLSVLAVAAVVTLLVVGHNARRPDGATAMAALETSLPGPVRRWRPEAVGVCETADDRPDAELAELVLRSAGQLVAPAFPLRSVVAANPLAGLEQLPFLAAAQVMQRATGARLFLPEQEYRSMFHEGRIHVTAIDQALADYLDTDAEADLRLARDELFELADQVVVEDVDPRGRTLAELRGGDQDPARIAELHDALWCAHVWGASLSAEPGELYRRWREAAAAGWGRRLGLRELAAGLPDDAPGALAELLGRSGLAEDQWFDYFVRLLTVAPGWAAHAAWREREGYAGALVELAAIRMAHDLAVGGRAAQPRIDPAHHDVGGLADSLVRRRIWQEALERTYRDQLVGQLSTTADGDDAVPEVQILMCIDVRSERLRRHLESVGGIQTFGFAGFFGAAVRYVTEYGRSYDQCPVLLKPTHELAGVPFATRTGAFAGRQALRAAWDTPVSPFALAESAGVFAGVTSAVQTFWPGLAPRTRLEPSARIDAVPGDGPGGFTVEELAALAESALEAIGLTTGFAALLVVAGHGATVQNNAFAAAYDCGACGGNGGLQNARVLAHALNHPGVREILAGRGIVIPDGVRAVAALHDTTTDRLQLDETPGESGRLLLEAFEAASDAASLERLRDLPGAPRSPDAAAARRHVRHRALDWAQPCPEWSLAGNAAFVIGPRWLTRDADLAGRVFLHSYDPDRDQDGGVLNAILNAPVVVAQWINSQYYFSTVDAERFGAGDKSTHNVIGEVGVMAGAHGDIRVGLPWQALFADEQAAHRGVGQHVPMRLSVIAYAYPDQVLHAIQDSEVLLRLVTNEWISVTVIDPSDGSSRSLRSSLQWQDAGRQVSDVLLG